MGFAVKSGRKRETNLLLNNVISVLWAGSNNIQRPNLTIPFLYSLLRVLGPINQLSIICGKKTLETRQTFLPP